MERMVARVEQGTTGDTTPSRKVAWVDASRHVDETDGECVLGNLKQGVFPKHDHHQQLV